MKTQHSESNVNSQQQNCSRGSDLQNTENNLSGEYLTFMVESEEYGVDILCVQEIRGWQAVRKIPNTPAYVRGVINLRGAIVPIIDMRERFGFELREYSATTVVIVLRSLKNNSDNENIVGVVVDAVSEVYDLELNQIKDAPDFGTNIDTRFIKGLADVEEKLVVLLDLEKFLNFDELHSISGQGSKKENEIENSS